MGFLTRLGEGIASAARVVGNAVKEVTDTVKEFVGDAWNAITFRLDVGYDHPEIIDMQMEQQSCEIVKEVLGGEPFDQFAVLLPAERKMAIENVIAETSDMMGVELEGIAFADLGDVSGFDSVKGKVIALNEEPLCQEVMTGEEAMEVIDTVFHELRHAYQFRAARYPSRYKRDKLTAAIWRLNWKNYAKFGQNAKLYFDQPLEVDARNFAISVINNLRRS